MEKHYMSLKTSAQTSLMWDLDPDEHDSGETFLVQPGIYKSQPGLDYGVIYRKLGSLVPHIRDRAAAKKYFQAYEDVAEARANYKKCYRRYHVAYTKLQDATAYHKIMSERKAKVEEVIKEWQEQEGMEVAVKEKRMELETIISQIDKNGKAGPQLLEELEYLASMKDAVSSVFASMKSNLIKNHLPRLVGLTKQVDERARLHRAQASRRADGPIRSGRPQRPHISNGDIVQRRQALSKYHQAVNSEVVNRKGTSPQLVKAVEQQIHIVADQASATTKG